MILKLGRLEKAMQIEDKSLLPLHDEIIIDPGRRN